MIISMQGVFNVSAYTINKTIKLFTGKTFLPYLTQCRMERAKELLSHADMSVAEISEVLGYENPSYFCRAFKKETKQSPSEYRRELCIEK